MFRNIILMTGTETVYRRPARLQPIFRVIALHASHSWCSNPRSLESLYSNGLPINTLFQ